MSDGKLPKECEGMTLLQYYMGMALPYVLSLNMKEELTASKCYFIAKAMVDRAERDE